MFTSFSGSFQIPAIEYSHRTKTRRLFSMKKLISILLGAAMLLSLAACTSTAAADDTESVPASSDTSTETPPELPDGEAPAMLGRRDAA